MKVNRKELMNVLQMLKPGLAKKDSVAQGVHFMSTGNEILSFSGRLCIRHPFVAFPFCVKGEEFFKVLDRIADETVEINEKGGKIHVEGSSVKAGLATLLETDEGMMAGIEAIQKETDNDRLALPKDFIPALFLTMFSAHPSPNEATMHDVEFIGMDAFSTDRLRMSWYVMDSEVPDRFLIDRSSATELVKFPSINEVIITSNWLHFFNPDGVSFSCIRDKGDSLKVKEKFSDLDDDNMIELPKTLREVINSISFLADEDGDKKYITVYASKNGITCKAEKEVGWIQKAVEWPEYDGEPFSFVINAEFFGQVLEKATKMKLIRDGRLGFFATENFYHVVGLMRGKNNG